jgi:outer membrane protein TolC
MKKLFITLLIVIGVINAQERALTLEESLQIGLQNSKQLKISQATFKSSEAKITEVGSQMLPQLSFGASYTRLSDVKPFAVTVPFSPTPITIQETILNNYQLKFSLQQPLFTGFRLSSLKSAAEYNSKAVELEHTKEINEEALRIHQAFWNYYKAQKVLQLVEENLKSLEKHLTDTKNFLENGLVTRNDLLKLEVQYSNTELKRIEAKNAVELARTTFNKSIGLPLNSKSQVSAEEPTATPITTKFDDLLSEALQAREEIKSLEYKIKAGEENIDAAQAGWFPSVFLFGDYYYSRPNQRIMPLEDKFEDTWAVGVGLSWNIWDWGETYAKTTQAEQQLIQAETTYQIIKENIELEVYKDYLTVLSEFEKVSVSKKSVEQAEENYRITKDKYNQQLATSSDLIDAEVALLNAQTNLTNALVDLKLAKTKLEKSLGRNIY